MNSRDSFPRRKVENQAQTSCSTGPILSLSVLSSTQKLRKRQTWKCAVMGNCQKFKCSVTLTLTLTLDRVKVISTYTVRVGLPAYPTMWL